MPSSNLAVAPTVLHMLWELRPADRPLRVLDVGPGWGKYERLIREYVDPDAYIAAVEAWEPYVTAHGLDTRYDLLVVGDIRDQPDEFFDGFDVVLLVDVLEHMPHPDGAVLLDRIPGWVIVSTPRDFFDTGPNLAPTEKHVSHWTLAEMVAMARYDIHDIRLHDELGGVVVRLRPR